MPEEPLRFGVLTPIVSGTVLRHTGWEAEGGPDELREVAIAADRLRFHHLTCSEHVGIPTAVTKVRGSRYYDPLATFGFMAAVTDRVKFLTHVIVLPYHHPLAIAKRYGTLDRLCKGRLILGVGVGTLREEFELLDAEFEGRADLYTDALPALRAAWGKPQPSYHGSHYQFEDFVIDPFAVNERVPIWLGGRTPRSLRRALSAGDGWDPFGLSLEQISGLIAKAKDWPEWRDRTEPFDVALSPEPSYDPAKADQRQLVVEQVHACQEAGATVLNLVFRATNLSHYLEQMEAFTNDVAPQFR